MTGIDPPPSDDWRTPRPKVDPTPFLLELSGVEGPLDWSTVFGNDHPVAVEVGSGKGLFLQNAAISDPSVNYVGVELAKKYARTAAQRIAKRSLKNVRVWPGDARLFLDKFVPVSSLSAVHVYFPDPWWKTRHKKRRVFAEPLVNDIERKLKPGGSLWIATDVEEYFGVIQELMALRSRFSTKQISPLSEPAHELDYLTNFERKYRIEGRPIYRAHYVLDHDEKGRILISSAN